ncbi:MAG TPA: M57 family metalloprotease [Thermoanaerobaculia bacterium]|nr:M57 family metalloprotease [Thermoanaerobaculia bacterium]
MRAARLLAAVLFLATTANAAMLLVPTDRELAEQSRAIVVATAISSHGVATEHWIETQTTFRVDESIKGALAIGETFLLAEPGGIAGKTGLAIAGSPRFADGERVLLMLTPRSNGSWTSRVLGAGVFRFEGDLLVRHELCGIDLGGATHVEPRRNALRFLAYLRGDSTIDYIERRRVASDSVSNAAVAPNAVTITSYLLQQGGRGIRWASFPTPVVFRSNGAQTGIADGGLGAAKRALAAWTDDPSSNIIYQYGGTTSAKGGLLHADGTHSMLFDDPNGEITGAFPNGSVLAIGGAWFSTDDTHVFGGETFYTIGEADLIVQNGIIGTGLNGLGFDHVLTHELGHTLGFRHSDDPPAGGTSSSTALMNSTVAFNTDQIGSTLQAWDREAVLAVYGSGVASCTPPSISQQPHSVDLTKPEAVTLTVAASGDAPLTFQWYVGESGVTNAPIGGATSASLTVTPTVSTSYWVRVSNGCAPPADSTTATITVAGCPGVKFTSVSESTEILQTRSATLSANATGGTISYQWYEGTTGVTARPVSGATGTSIVVTPPSTTSYWVRASNTCGSALDSPTIIVTVVPCNTPRVLIQPAGGTAAVGDTPMLFADITGTTPLNLQWYRGAKGDTSQPLANAKAESITVPPLLGPDSFWLQATNDCGSVNTDAAAFSLVSQCQRPLIIEHPANLSVGPGTTATLKVVTEGTSLQYRWYEGAQFDFTKPLGGSSPTLITPPILEPTEFWLVITNGCGTAESETITVTPVATKRRAARH